MIDLTSLRYKMHRARETPVPELARKVATRLKRPLLARRLGRGAVDSDVERVFVPRRYLVDPRSTGRIAQKAGSRYPEAVAHVVGMADEIMDGRLRLHRIGAVEFRDAEDVWTRFEAGSVERRLLGRHDFLVLLALAHCYTGESEYREVLVDHLEAWLSPSPTRDGEKAIDSAKRQTNWAWLRQFPGLLEGCQELWRDWARAVVEDVRHTIRHMTPGGNHLALEALGLWSAGIANPELELSHAWRSWSYQKLVEVTARQFTRDGFHRERSTIYHLVVTRVLLEFVRSAERRGLDTPGDVGNLVNEAATRIAQFRLPDDSLPLLGDSDAFCARELDHLRYRGVVDLGVTNISDSVKGHCDWFGKGPGADLSLWYSGATQDAERSSGHSVATHRARRLDATAGPLVLEGAGYTVMRVGRQVGESLVILDTGPLGMEGFPHHGHADALSIVAYLAGEPVLVDPGGYSYSDVPLRRWIRSTAAHNTVSVDRRDQSELVSVDGVGYRARARLLGSGASAGFQWAAGEVSHHRAHPAKPTHRRTVAVSQAPVPVLLVLDEVWSSPGATATLSWHLHPDISTERTGRGWALGSASSGSRIACLSTASGECRWEEFRGVAGERPEGWYVPDALDVRPATTLELEVRSGQRGYASIGTSFLALEAAGRDSWAESATLTLGGDVEEKELLLGLDTEEITLGRACGVARS